MGFSITSDLIPACRLVIGMGLILAVLFDVFETVVVPNLGSRYFRLTTFLIRRVLWIGWRSSAIVFKKASTKRDFLSQYAPASVLISLWTWLLTFLIGFALVVTGIGRGVNPPIDNVATAFYFAGSAVLTVGFGDIVPTSPLMRVAVIFGTISGLTIMALATSLIFSLHAHYQSREAQIVMLEGRAGIPPNALTILEYHAKQHIVKDIHEFFAKSEVWLADILTSHISYPFLLFFRSLSFGNSWVTSIGAVMDTCLITQTMIHLDMAGGSDLTYGMGLRVLVEIDKFYRFQAPKYDAELERDDFNKLRESLSTAGYHLRDEGESWKQFAHTRAEYWPLLAALARYMAMPCSHLIPLTPEQFHTEMLKVYSNKTDFKRPG